VCNDFLRNLRAEHCLGEEAWFNGLLTVGSHEAVFVNVVSEVGGPDWNVSSFCGVTPLDTSTLGTIFGGFASEYGFKMSEDVLAEVLLHTGGHRGWCMCAGRQLQEQVVQWQKHSDEAPSVNDLWARARGPFLAAIHSLQVVQRCVAYVAGLPDDNRQEVVQLLRSSPTFSDEKCAVDLGSETESTSRILRALLGFGVLTLANGTRYRIMDGPRAYHMHVVKSVRFAVRPPECDLTADQLALIDAVLQRALVSGAFLPVLNHLAVRGCVTTEVCAPHRRPSEHSYKLAMASVLCHWLGWAAVEVEPCVGSDKRNVDLWLTVDGKEALVELVSHSRCAGLVHGKPRAGTVQEHLHRLVTVYGAARPRAQLWLINFDWRPELASGTHCKTVLLSDEAWQRVHRVNVILSEDGSAVHSVAYWPAGSSGASVAWAVEDTE
jgi:hypothetical protein